MKEWLNDRNVKTNSVLRKKMVKITYPHYWFFCKTMICWCAANWNKSDRISLSTTISFFLDFIVFLFVYLYLWQFYVYWVTIIQYFVFSSPYSLLLKWLFYWCQNEYILINMYQSNGDLSCFTTIELKIANTVGMDWFVI